MKVNLVKGLTFNGDYTFIRKNTKYKDVGLIPNLYNTWGLAPTAQSNCGTTSTWIETDHSVFQNQVFNGYFNYAAMFNDAHNLNVMVGANLDKADYEYLYYEMHGIQDSNMPELALANEYYTYTHEHTHQGSAGFFGRINYDYKGKYLFEGTYSKYVSKDATRANKYLTEAKNACQTIMSSGKFKLNSDYKSNFDSDNLNGNEEMILYKHYVQGIMGHGTIDYTCGSTQVNGMTKDAFDSYLFRDGKPLATTTMDKSDKGIVIEIDDKSGYGTAKHIDISRVLANRDPRLSAQVDPILQFPGSGYARFGGAQSTASTGYGVLLFDNVKYSNDNASRQSTNGNYSDAPIFWYAEILLNYAEACAELGSITDADLNKSINLLRDRVSMPHLTTAVAADPANNMGVSPIIWEVRRERRVEMMYCMNDRYYSLQRWNQLDKLDTQKYPNLSRGAYVKGFDAEGVVTKDVTIDADGYINCKNNGAERIYDPKYLLFPIPNDQITLNKQIGQNPGW